MSDANKPFSLIKMPFGDGEYDFALTWSGGQEWEENTGRMLFHTFNVMVSTQTGFMADVREIIRIALIGGGLAPTDAFKLVKRYVEERPLSESMPVALTAMEAFLFGTDDVQSQTEETANG